MSAKVQISRGDIKLKQLDEGELFWSFINTDPTLSNGHSFSLGQLWIKDPSKEEPTEVANIRSLDALRLVGEIDNGFDGDFVNSPLPLFNRCHSGDVFIIKETIPEEKLGETYYKNDLLIITDTVYEEVENGEFRDKLSSVSYRRYPGTDFSNEGTDLEAENIQDAIEELSLRLKYAGEFYSYEDFAKASNMKRGHLFYLREDVILNSEIIKAPEDRVVEDFAYLRRGDFVFWNGEKWHLIPSGLVPADIKFVVKPEVLNKYDTFEEYHKHLFENCKNLQDVIDVLISDKAPLNSLGKIPYSVLPDSVRNGLSLKGKWHPIIDPEINIHSPDNQNDWPKPTNEYGELITEYQNGWFYIVDCDKHSNVKYRDKHSETERTLELNSGDFIVYCEATHQFEIIDNSDRISSLIFEDFEGNEHDLVKNVKFKGKGSLKITVSDNVATFEVENIVSEARPYYHVMFDEHGKLKYSSVFEDEGIIKAKGPVRVMYTAGESASGYINNGFEILSKINVGETIQERLTKIKASEIGEDLEVNLVLPRTDAKVVGEVPEDNLIKDYLVKAQSDGFITDSLIKETIFRMPVDGKSGEVNIGSGKTKSEDLLTGEISFFGKTEDGTGFYSMNVPRELDMQLDPLIEHFLDETSSKTTIKINPKNLRYKKVSHLTLPEDDGVITTFEEQFDIYSANGEALIIPVWENFTDHDRPTLGLSISPISIKMNRTKSGEEDTDRTSDLTETETYTNAETELLGPTEENIVSFDAWLESKRVVASKQGFVMPSANETPTNNIKETGHADSSHKMASILPSETHFKGNKEFTDMFNNHIEQNVEKVIELPAESGVLVTHESIIRSRYYHDPD